MTEEVVKLCSAEKEQTHNLMQNCELKSVFNRHVVEQVKTEVHKDCVEWTLDKGFHLREFQE